jgi:hypothetical protein
MSFSSRNRVFSQPYFPSWPLGLPLIPQWPARMLHTSGAPHAAPRPQRKGSLIVASADVAAQPSTLVVVESPAKAKKIQTYLGVGYKVHPLFSSRGTGPGDGQLRAADLFKVCEMASITLHSPMAVSQSQAWHITVRWQVVMSVA